RDGHVMESDVCSSDLNRPNRRARMTAKYNATKVAAINRLRNGQPKASGAEPFLFVIGNGRRGDLIEPNLLRVERWTNVAHGRGRFLGKALKVGSVEAVDELNFATLETEQLKISIL